MSVLLGHVKAFRALAKAYGTLSVEVGPGTAEGRIWSGHGAAYLRAADDLESQMRLEASQPIREEEWLPQGVGDGAG